MKESKRRWAALRFRGKIRNILLTYYLTPIFLILLASAAFFYYTAKRSLDEEMGLRLRSIAQSTASQLRGYHLAALALRDPNSLTLRNLQDRFVSIRKENALSKVYLFDFNDESLLDTDPAIDLGSKYERNQLHLAELDAVKRGESAASVLFQGLDGQYYKSAFAPVMENGKVLALVGVDGSATFFTNLHRLGRQLTYFVLICVVAIIIVSILLSRKIVNPIQHLVASAQRIGEGHLNEPIEISSPNELGFLGFVLDEMRKSIINRDRELQMMLQGIAHEVRNPLGGIELFAGMLEEEVRDPQASDAIARIQKEIQTLKSLVDEFLDFARGPSLQIASVPIQPFFDDLRIAFQKELEARSVQMELNLDGVGDVEFDTDQMRRAFLNLIHNSLQAMPGGGKINLEARSDANQVELSVRDTGVGIPEEHLEKLFDPFFTTKERGSGLGLSFVRKIVNAHGGEVKVSSAVGEGTTFTIALPKA